MSMKNPMTLAGIEPATFRFVAQHLNHCATEKKKIVILFQTQFLQGAVFMIGLPEHQKPSNVTG